MADAPEAEAQPDIDEANNELYLSDGEAWFRDIYALCDTYEAIGVAQYEGVLVAMIPGRGVVSIADLLVRKTKPAKLHAAP